MSPEVATSYVGLLNHLRGRLASEAFLHHHRKSKKDFTHNRCLSFVVVVLMLINVMKRSLLVTSSNACKPGDGDRPPETQSLPCSRHKRPDSQRRR